MTKSISRKLQEIHTKLLFMTNRKLHMHFRLTPRSMTLDELELYKFEFSENFSGFRRFGRQQQEYVFELLHKMICDLQKLPFISKLFLLLQLLVT